MNVFAHTLLVLGTAGLLMSVPPLIALPFTTIDQFPGVLRRRASRVRRVTPTGAVASATLLAAGFLATVFG
jgi:hypothetical protein